MTENNNRRFEGEWVKLEDVLTEYKEINAEGKYRPVAIGRYGIRFREDIYTKELAKDYSKNKVICRNTLTVGMGSKQIDIGILTSGECYSVSPAYHTYKINGIDCDYLRYCLEARNADMFKRYAKRGSRQGKTIDLKRWLTYKIPLPDSEDQLDAVRHLNLINGQIEYSNKDLDGFDDLVKSRFTEMFEMMPVSRQSLESCCTFIDYRGKTPPKTSSGIPLITAKNVRKGHFSKEPQEFISEDDYEAWMTRGFPDNGDVLFTTEAPLGNVCRIPEEPTKFALAQRIVAIQPYEELLNKCYVSHALQSSEFQRQVQRNSSGTTAKGIRVKLLKQLLIPVPPLSLQQEFADFVAQVDKLRFDVQQQIEKLETLKQSLMQEYFG